MLQNLICARYEKIVPVSYKYTFVSHLLTKYQ